MIQEFAAMAPERRAEVASMIQEFAAVAPERRVEVADMIREFAAMAPERRDEVATMIREFAAQAPERRDEIWGTAPARAAVAPPPKVAPPVEELAEEAVVEEVPAGELRDIVFAYLANHPDGAKLVELEEEFGVARIQMAKVIRELIDDNLVDKRDLFYFVI